jgi:hypothetical protein
MSDGVNPSEIVLVQETRVPAKRKLGKERWAGGVRDKLTMGEMKARMAALWKEGESYVQIAETVSDEFGLEGDARLKANGINFHITKLKQYWRDQSLLHIDERQAVQLARLDQLEQLAMDAYFVSCQGSTTSNYEKQIDRARSKDRERMLQEQIAEERERRKANLHGNVRDNPKFQFEINDGEIVETLITTHEKIKEYERRDERPAGDPKWVAIIVDIWDKRNKLWGMYNRTGPDSDDAERARLSDEQRDERIAAVLNAAINRRREITETNLAPIEPLAGFDEPQDTAIEDFVEQQKYEQEAEAMSLGEKEEEVFEFDFEGIEIEDE